MYRYNVLELNIYRYNNMKKKIFVLVLVIIIIGIGLTGFVPGLSSLLGANKPRNLGVEVSEEKYNYILNTVGFELNNQIGLGSDTKISYQGQKNINVSLSESDLSSLLSFNHAELFPVKNVQVKIHQNGTVEASANVSINNYKGYSLNNAVYVKGKIDVISSRNIKIKPDEVEIGRIPLPMTEKMISVLNNEANQYINKIEGLSIESVSYEDGKVNFKGTIPSKATRIKR